MTSIRSRTNAFMSQQPHMLAAGTDGKAIYPTFSFLSHSCKANARYIVMEDDRLVLRAQVSTSSIRNQHYLLTGRHQSWWGDHHPVHLFPLRQHQEKEGDPPVLVGLRLSWLFSTMYSGCSSVAARDASTRGSSVCSLQLMYELIYSFLLTDPV